MPSGKTDSISKGDRVKVVGGMMLSGQSGIALGDSFGRSGRVMVQFEGYPKPMHIDASRLLVTKHDPNSPKVTSPHTAAPQPANPLLQPIIQISSLPNSGVPQYINMQGAPLTKEMFGEAHRAMVFQRFPGESDADYSTRVKQAHTDLRRIIRGNKTSKEKALATRQALVQSFPTQEDRDEEEAFIHTRAQRLTDMRRARLNAAYWK